MRGCRCRQWRLHGAATGAAQADPQLRMQFADASFDVILDKGSLDALMGEDCRESASAGGAYLAECARLLRRPGGSFLCITLAQDHVLRTPAARAEAAGSRRGRRTGSDGSCVSCACSARALLIAAPRLAGAAARWRRPNRTGPPTI